MLHHTQIPALAKEFAELFHEKGADAVRAAMPKTYGSKNAEVDAEDVEDVISRLESGEIKPQPRAKDVPQVENKKIDLSGFDYRNLNGDAWAKYNEVVAALKDRELYDFKVYRVVPVKKERYPGMKESPVDVVGIRLIQDAPVQSARIEAKHARNLNAQLPNGNTKIPCQYYLLAK